MSCRFWQRPLRSPRAAAAAGLLTAAALLPGLVQPLRAEAIAAGSVFRDCRDCPEMVVLPAGFYAMGSGADEHLRFGVPAEQSATELPLHPVRIARPFAVGRFPVTRDEWARFAQSAPPADAAAEASASAAVTGAGCAALTPATGVWAIDAARSWRDPGFPQTGRHPVVCVGWGEAKAYADWLSATTGNRYRLLSEAEWEYAARAGTTTANYWGANPDKACEHANASDLTRAERHPDARARPDSSFRCHDGHVFTAPVDAFAPNAFGLYGMSGNVWQWVEDCFSASHDGAPADASPRRDGDCRYRVDRGASWVNSPRYLRAAARHKDLLQARTSVLGVRLARELSP